MSEETKVLYEEICELLEQRKFNTLRDIIIEMNEVDIAELIDEATPEQEVIIFRLLPKQLAAEAFAYMDSETRERLVMVLADRELRLVMQELFVDDVASMLEEMPAGVVKKMLKATSAEDRREINQILQYPEDSAGSVLTTECVRLKAAMTVADAFEAGVMPRCHLEDITRADFYGFMDIVSAQFQEVFAYLHSSSAPNAGPSSG